MPATDFPLDKLGAVIYNPADRSPGEAGRGCVFLSPGHHALRCIHVAHRSTGFCTGNCCTSGIGKQIKNADRPTGRTNLICSPVPVGSLFGEDPGMLEVHRLDIENKVPVTDLPGFRKFDFTPAPAARLTAVIAGVAGIPAFVCARRRPDCLGIRTDEEKITPAFELFPFRTVYQFKVLPLIRNPHTLLRTK